MPACPLPAQAYLPGTGMAHPVAENEGWIYGVDLFNHGFFWEAHEAWESLWQSSDKGSSTGLILRGLIQIAAALLKIRQRNFNGVRILSERGMATLSFEQAEFQGLELASWRKALVEYLLPLRHFALPDLAAYPRIVLKSDPR